MTYRIYATQTDGITQSIRDLLSLINGEPWMEQGICRTTDPERFFPPQGSGSESRTAKALCLECPVLTECREWAMPQADLWGIAGGLSRHDRAAIRREAKETPTRPNLNLKESR